MIHQVLRSPGSAARSRKTPSNDITLRVHVHNYLVLGMWVIMVVVQLLGKYMIIGYLDP